MRLPMTLAFASDKKKGKQPRLASMIAECHIRPPAEKFGIRPEGYSGFGLHNCRHELSTWMIDCGVEPLVVMRALESQADHTL
jgi:hypothetical protein